MPRQLIEEMEGNGIVDLTINSHDLERAEGAWHFVSNGLTNDST